MHGAFYYNAARSNGLSFGESIPFAIVGAYAWQLVFERDAHSFNDFSTTSMNGPTIGEPFHRLALMVRDDRTRGTERILRELAEGSPGGWSLTVALNDSATALSTGLPGLEKTCST